MAKSEQINARVPIGLYQELQDEAEARGITMSNLIRILLTNALTPATFKEPTQSE